MKRINTLQKIDINFTEESVQIVFLNNNVLQVFKSCIRNRSIRMIQQRFMSILFSVWITKSINQDIEVQDYSVNVSDVLTVKIR